MRVASQTVRLLIWISLVTPTANARPSKWCQNLISATADFADEPVRSYVRGEGAQGRVYEVYDADGVHAEKVLRRDAHFEYPGLKSMWEVAQHEAFQLHYCGELLRRFDLDLRTPRVLGLINRNRFGLTTDAEIEPGRFIDRDNPAPTLKMEFIRGRTLHSLITDRSLSDMRRLNLLLRKNALTRRLQAAIDRHVPSNRIEDNSNHCSHARIQLSDGLVYECRDCCNLITVTGVPDAPTRGGVVSLSTSNSNIVVTDDNAWVLIDLN